MAAATQVTKGKNMKKIVLSIALAFVAPFAWGQVSETTTTTTTTDASGTITEYSPGSTIVLKESSGPRHYRFGKSVTYVTRSGKVLEEDVVTRIHVLWNRRAVYPEERKREETVSFLDHPVACRRCVHQKRKLEEVPLMHLARLVVGIVVHNPE